jgi:hypothetical protein
MAQIRCWGLARMPPAPWSTGHPVARGRSRGEGERVNHRQIWPPHAVSRLQLRSPCHTHCQNAEGGGGGGHPTTELNSTRQEPATGSRSDCHQATVTAETLGGGGSGHLTLEPAATRRRTLDLATALFPPPNAEHTSPPLRPFLARPTTTQGVDEGPLPPSSPTPRVVLMVGSDGSAA